MTGAADAGALSVRNIDVAWEKFDSESYSRANYGQLLEEDQQLIGWLSGFLVEHFRRRPPIADLSAIDIGAGSNLYPAMLMLPWARRITLADFSTSNVQWLKEHLHERSGPWRWQPFWDLVSPLPEYARVADPRRALSRPAVVQASVFELPRAEWDLGTMFFVAESITQDEGEFHQALAAFLGSLRSGAAFAIAFMEQSIGYEVADLRLPAVSVSREHVEKALAELPVQDCTVHRTDKPRRPVRDGYERMLLATGVVK